MNFVGYESSSSDESIEPAKNTVISMKPPQEPDLELENERPSSQVDLSAQNLNEESENQEAIIQSADVAPPSQLKSILKISGLINEIPLLPSTTHFPESQQDQEAFNRLQSKITAWTKYKDEGRNFNDVLNRTAAFRNPTVMTKMASFLGLIEMGSEYPKHMYDPDKVGFSY